MDESQGRTNQKRRTRSELVKAAAKILRDGGVPGVAEAAEAAAISRATAYRYFASQDFLLAEVSLDAATAPVEQLLASAGFPAPAEERLERLLDAVYDMLFANERAFRALLRLSLQAGSTDAPKRGARRLAWLETALAPLRGQLRPAAFQSLIESLAVWLGVECVVVLRDVCGLEPEAVRRTARDSARAILRAALDGSAVSGSARAARSSGPATDRGKRPAR